MNLRSLSNQFGLQIFCLAFLLTAAISFRAAAQGAPPAAKPAEATSPASATLASLAGAYNGNQMEVAARLLLKPDGHFLYELAYGALDEEAQGTWEIHADAVYLTTVPAVVPPRFVVVSDKPEPRGGLWIKIGNGPLMEGAPQRIYLLYGPKDEPDMAEVAADGHVPLTGNRMPTAIIPEIPVYPVMSKPIPITGTGGHSFVLRFERNDIGKADFHLLRLGIEDGALVMPRRDLRLMLHFKREPKKDGE
jgi:hypothetical protein